MAFIENNTAAGNVTTADALPLARFCKRVQDGQLYIKLNSTEFKKCDDDAQNYALEPSEAVIEVAASNINATFDA